MARYSKSASKDVKGAMERRKAGTLKSGKSGKTVKSKKQAIAIGLLRGTSQRQEGSKQEIHVRPGEPSVGNPLHIAHPARRDAHLPATDPSASCVGPDRLLHRRSADRPHVLVVGGYDVGGFFRVACDRWCNRRPYRRHFRIDRLSQQPTHPRPETGVAACDRERRAAYSRDAQHVRSLTRRVDLGCALGSRAFGGRA